MDQQCCFWESSTAASYGVSSVGKSKGILIHFPYNWGGGISAAQSLPTLSSIQHGGLIFQRIFQALCQHTDWESLIYV